MSLSRQFANTPHILVRGAGIIGLACALELLRRGATVSICDTSQPGRGASWAAAGLLGPAYEVAAHGEHTPNFLRLCLASAELWPDFAARLERVSGAAVGYRRDPTLATGHAQDIMSALAARLAAQGLPFRHLTEKEARQIEPALSSGIGDALELPTDVQVDNRAVITALVRALERQGVTFREPSDKADLVLETIGWRDENCHPVKGQLLSFAPYPGAPERVIRSGSLYIVPKADRTIVGATEEPGEADTETDKQALSRLRSRATSLCPALAGAAILERWAGVRPTTRDSLPVIGWRDKANGRFVATGHFRNGILLAPVTAKIVADALLGGNEGALLPELAPDRFASSQAQALDGSDLEA